MILMMLIAFIAFLLGFSFGNIKKPNIKKVTVKTTPDPETEKQRLEYLNFLNYDGSEQS